MFWVVRFWVDENVEKIGRPKSRLRVTGALNLYCIIVVYKLCDLTLENSRLFEAIPKLML
jgi:hypothetical protein